MSDSRARRMLRSPALHFVALGLLLFGLRAGFGPDARAERRRAPIVIEAERIERLRERYEASSGLVASPADVEALISREIEEQALFLEALALGLDRADPGVQWRLIEKMSFLEEDGEGATHANDATLLEEARALGLGRDDPVVRRILTEQMRLRLRHLGAAGEPSERELEAWLAAHREDFAQPALTRLTHVFLANARGAALDTDARALVAALRAEAPAAEVAVARGDPFALPQQRWTVTSRQLSERLGADFAEAVDRLAPGAWSDPIRSPYGLHAVQLHERLPERMPKLAEVRGRVLYGLLAERRATAEAERLRALVAAYEVRVERPAWLARLTAPEPRS